MSKRYLDEKFKQVAKAVYEANEITDGCVVTGLMIIAVGIVTSLLLDAVLLWRIGYYIVSCLCVVTSGILGCLAKTGVSYILQVGKK